MVPIKRWGGGVIVLVLVMASGCKGSPQPEPDPPVLSFAEKDGTVFFLRLKEVGTIIICCDIPGGAGGTGSSGSGPPPVRKAHGYAFAKDGRRVDWELEITDGGKSVRFSANGNEYDLSRGGLFLVKTKGGKTEVEQLNQDLSTVHPDIEGCRNFVRTNPATSKLLGEGADLELLLLSCGIHLPI
jgi:hypothetical protein